MSQQFIQSLSAQQRDDLLERLLFDRNNTNATTETEQVVMEAVDQHFCSELSDEMLDAPAQVASSVEFEIDEFMSQAIWDFEDYMSGPFEEFVISQFDGMFKAGRDMTCEALEGEVDADFLRNVRYILPSSFDEEAKAALIGDFQDEIPEIMSRAIRWYVDTDAIDNAIYGYITRYLSAAVIPNLKAQICSLEFQPNLEVATQ